MAGARWRFRGEIAGVGSSSGIRVVVGRWLESPLGSFADVMLERADGHRILLAPTREVAEFITATYQFDTVLMVPVSVRATLGSWVIDAGPLQLGLSVGSRTALGWALSAIPDTLAASTGWATAIDPVARIALRGVRTRGTAGGARREWYGATDVHRVVQITGSYDGAPLGELTRVEPPVRFGFGSTPAAPSVTSVVTTIQTLPRKSAPTP